MSTTVKTRKMVTCAVFGKPQEMSETVLPTYENVMKYYLLVKHEMKPTVASKEPTITEISQKVAQNVERLWLKASIPVISHTRVLHMIRSYYDKYIKIKKNKKRNESEAKATSFRGEAQSKLFDIAACKCSFEACNCDKTRKVPRAEQDFLRDQRSIRLMVMGNIDKLASKKLSDKLLRKNKEKHRRNKHLMADVDTDTPISSKGDSDRYDNVGRPTTSDAPYSDDDTMHDEYSGCETGEHDVGNELPVAVNKSANAVSRNLGKLPALARACDRHGISDRFAAAIATAVLEDIGVITANDSSKVIDRCKIRRERKRKRYELQSTQDAKIVRGICFDGRKDNTLINTKEGSKYYRRTVTEEHISLIQEPESMYLSHTSPDGSSAKDISRSIANFIATSNIDTEKLVAIRCDGTNVNTGRKGGVIRLLEQEYTKPLQWLVCLLHANELPLRHLLQHLDGSTAGPKAFSGPIGKALTTCETLPVVSFDKIEVDMPIVVLKELSRDQQYLWEICDAVSKGQCSLDLSKRNPGALNHSRWLTTANRLLRLYVASSDPSPNLKELVTYIMRVYAPLWFCIKMNSSCKDGARHLFRMIQLSRYLSNELRDVIDPVLQRNGYFGHPENLLLAMISDKRPHVRELGLRRILKARTEKQDALRQFSIPKLDLNASEYFELIDWQHPVVTEPPLTMDVSEADIKLFVKTGGQSTIEFERYPCHTQSVERCVKIVTEASLAVCGQLSRDGFIRSRLEGRRIMPVFNTKAEYRLS